MIYVGIVSIPSLSGYRDTIFEKSTASCRGPWERQTGGELEAANCSRNAKLWRCEQRLYRRKSLRSRSDDFGFFPQ